MCRFLITAVFLFIAQCAFCDDVESLNVRCFPGAVKKFRVELSERHLKDRVSIEQLLHEILVERYEQLSQFLSNDKRINEPDFEDQAMEFFASDEDIFKECFYTEYKKGGLIRRFEQRISDDRASGFALVRDGQIVAVQYISVVKF